MTITKKMVMDRLLDLALMDSAIAAYPNERKIANAKTEGKPIPEECLPGRLLNKLSNDEREVLKTISSSDWNHRVK